MILNTVFGKLIQPNLTKRNVSEKLILELNSAKQYNNKSDFSVVTKPHSTNCFVHGQFSRARARVNFAGHFLLKRFGSWT